MSDGKKTDVPGAPLNDSVPTETPKLLRQDLGLDRRAPRPVPGFDQLQKPARPPAANLKETTPSYPGPATPRLDGPEFAPTVISNKDAQPHPLDYAKTQASEANPGLAKLQAAERATQERFVAERQLAERIAAEKAVNERLVASRLANPLRPPVASVPGAAAALPVHSRDPSLLQTDPNRPMPSSPLRQQLANRPLAPAAPVAAASSGEVITDPMPRVAVPSPSRPAPATVAQRPHGAPLPQAQKTDPMPQPDVPGAMARGLSWPSTAPMERTEIGRPPGLAARVPAAAPLPVTKPMSPVERTELRPALEPFRPLPRTTLVNALSAVDGAHEPLRAPPRAAGDSPVETFRPLPRAVTAPAVSLMAAPNEPTDIALPAITAPRPLPGVPMPASASARTEVGRPIPPGVAMPASALRTEAVRVPLAVAPVAPPRPPAGPQVTLTPAKHVTHEDLAPIPERKVTPAPRPAPAPSPPRAKVAPPSFMDLPAAMEQPRRVGLDYATTQPGIPGPYMKPKLSTAPEPASVPSDTEEVPAPLSTDTASDHPALSTSPDGEVASDQVIASPASLWRRVTSSLIDVSVIGGAVVGLLLLAISIIGGKPVPNHVHGIDVIFFRLNPIWIPALALTATMAVLYTTLGAFLLNGRTLGRLLLGIRLVDSSGRAPGVLRSLLRSIFAIVSFAFFLAGFWLALFDRHGQTLHDKLTRTFVVRPV